jgi:hypothetical protein
VDVLTKKTKENPEAHVDITAMYNFTTFDVMGDLTFGEPLHMLEKGDYDPWVASIFAGFKIGAYLQCMRKYPAIERLLLNFVPESLKEAQRLHNEFSVGRVNRRLEKQDARPDIWGLVLKKEGKNGGISKREMYGECQFSACLTLRLLSDH